MSVFVDTSALFALVGEDDRREEALAALASLVEQQARLVTHNYVVVEATALVTNRLGMDGTVRLHREILPAVDREWVSQSLHDRAVEEMLTAGRAVSLVDRVSFGFMRDHRLPTAFAFDDDFTRAGFTTIPMTVGRPDITKRSKRLDSVFFRRAVGPVVGQASLQSILQVADIDADLVQHADCR